MRAEKTAVAAAAASVSLLQIRHLPDVSSVNFSMALPRGGILWILLRILCFYFLFAYDDERLKLKLSNML